MIVQPRLVGEDQVVGLEIAVDDPLRVRVAQARQQLPRDVQRARRRLRPLPVHRLAQGAPGDEVHDQIGRALDAEVDHRHAVRVSETAHRARLVLEAAEEGLLRGDPGMQELHRDRPAELHPLALVDHAHRAGGDLGQDAVAALQHRADARIGRRGVGGCGGRRRWRFHDPSTVSQASAPTCGGSCRSICRHERNRRHHLRSRGKKPGGSRINTIVAISVAITATFTALCNVKDGNIVQAMAQEQASAVDAWAYYQSKSTKENIAQSALDQLELQRDLAAGMRRRRRRARSSTRSSRSTRRGSNTTRPTSWPSRRPRSATRPSTTG